MGKAAKFIRPPDRPALFEFHMNDRLVERLVMAGPMGVLENVIVLLGYEQLCFLTQDDPAFLDEVFERVGSRFVRFYEIAAGDPAFLRTTRYVHG